MNQIRLCRRNDIGHGKDSQVQNGGDWIEATLEARRKLKIIA